MTKISKELPPRSAPFVRVQIRLPIWALQPAHGPRPATGFAPIRQVLSSTAYDYHIISFVTWSLGVLVYVLHHTSYIIINVGKVGNDIYQY